MKVFVTGGAGFIGSHACAELLLHGYQILVFDNLSNSSPKVLNNVEILTRKKIEFVLGDIRDKKHLAESMQQFTPDVVLHFAGLKSVDQSIKAPLKYYDVNVKGSLNVLDAMASANCEMIVFSSSATVYGKANYLPLDEQHPLNPTSPYGFTKMVVEKVLDDWTKSGSKKRAVCLRYFNPVGAHTSGMIGELLSSSSSNLMPFILKVAVGLEDELVVFGNDYPTKDGTGERDYIHVSDLAMGHLKAIERIKTLNRFQTLNLGTGKSISVLELKRAFERVSGKKIKIRIAERRPGDLATSWADTSLAERLLDISFTRSIEEMCQDAWKWQLSCSENSKKVNL